MDIYFVFTSASYDNDAEFTCLAYFTTSLKYLHLKFPSTLSPIASVIQTHFNRTVLNTFARSHIHPDLIIIYILRPQLNVLNP